MAILDEAIALRKSGIEAPILVLGVTDVRDITLAVNYNIILTVPSLKWLETSLPVLETSQVTLRFHLKLDLGMGRIGVREREELKTLLEVVKASPYLSLEGVFTHFATVIVRMRTILIIKSQDLNNYSSVLKNFLKTSTVLTVPLLYGMMIYQQRLFVMELGCMA